MAKQPVFVVQDYWPVEVAVFRHEKEGRPSRYTLVPSISFKNDEGWQSGTSYDELESWRLIAALQHAQSRVAALRREDYAAWKQAQSA